MNSNSTTEQHIHNQEENNFGGNIYDTTLHRLTKLKKEAETYQPLSTTEISRLEQQIRFEHIRFEGNPMTKLEVIEIFKLSVGARIHDGTIKAALEILNLNSAYAYMNELATQKQPITISDIRNLNRFATSDTVQSKNMSGKYRSIVVYPCGGSKHRPIYADPLEIREKMEQLQAWSSKASKKLHPVQYATDLHQKFVTIHPFIDGNGRTARLLMNLVLTENGYPVINLNSSHQTRSRYMRTLFLSNPPNNNPRPFRNLITRYVEKELRNWLSTLQLRNYLSNIK